MAWASLAAGLGFPLLILGTESRELGDIAYPFYIFVGSVVGAYIGFSVVDDKNFKDFYEHDRDLDEAQFPKRQRRASYKDSI